ncbi:GNAT family N-acetyltransferase [Streptomyces sp. NPDC015492]|uniref:GNAT family N-acetyltransferase n=1 Tax=Streptomyces sp. NPDC015492 TaxID=3364958 RepID=UPI0036F98D2F
MSTISLTPLGFAQQEMAEVVDLYISNPEYCRAAGEYDPDRFPADQAEADLREEAAVDGAEVMLARDARGRSVGLLSLLDRHPTDGFPWIGLLLVHGRQHRQGIGSQLAEAVEERFRSRGHDGLRLAVLESTPAALDFWTSLGWREIARRPDVQHGRPCIVMHKPLT